MLDAVDQGHLAAVRAMGGLEASSSAFGALTAGQAASANKRAQSGNAMAAHAAAVCGRLGIELHHITDPPAEKAMPTFSWT
jgi:hypothetical protein